MIALALLVLILATALHEPGRGDITRDVFPDSASAVLSGMAPEYSGPHAFRAFRSGQRYIDRRYRDVELLWDERNLDSTVVWRSQALDATLHNFATSLVDLEGTNPFGAPYSKFRWLYEYFRNPEASSPYSTDPRNEESVTFGTGVDAYDPPDRSHVDLYLWDRLGRYWHYGPGGRGDSTLLSNGGQYPSMFISGEEDLSTGHGSDSASVLHDNSLMVESPLEGQWLDESGSGWTHPEALQCLRFAHEFRHGMPGVLSGQLLGELFSAGAEAVSGNHTEETRYPMAYTWSLLATTKNAYGGAPPDCETNYNLRYQDHNYQGWSAFSAYLAYNFRGADTTATLAGMQDDLLHRWAIMPTPSWAALRELLGDDSTYPWGGVTSDTLRLALLLHNWRIASYVNNPALAGRQYGYQVDSLFSPGLRLGAWQAMTETGVCHGRDSLIIVPPEITLKAEHATRDTVLPAFRSNAYTTYPLVFQPLGSEYWVIRSDQTSQKPGQDLVITVYVDSLGHFVNRTVREFPNTTHVRGGGRLLASAVGYSEQAVNGTPQPLWQHPAWATRVIEPQWTDVDTSGATALRLVVPSFGDSLKAVVVVLSMADDPEQDFTTLGQLDLYEEVASYRLQLALRRAPCAEENPERVDWLGNYDATSPAFAPDGVQLAFTRESPAGGGGQVCRTSLVTHGTNVLNPSGAVPQLGPDWSPRGDWVAYEHPETGQPPLAHIVLYNILTQEERVLSPGLQGRARAPAFSPNGQQLVYAAQLTTAAGDIDSTWELRRIDLSGLNETVLVRTDSSRRIMSPRWSPGGGWIWFTSRDTLYRVKADGSLLRAATAMGDTIANTRTFDLHRGTGPILVAQADSITYNMSYSTVLGGGSGGVVLLRDRPFRRIALRDTLQRLPLPQFEQRYATASDPRWSYDGTRIAYVSDASAIGSASDIYVGQVSWNHAPQFVNAPRDTLLAAACAGAQTLTQTYSATDPDDEAVTFSAAYLPAGATLSTSGEFSWPDPGPPGSEHYVVIRALDGSGGVAQKVIRIAIEADNFRPAAAEVVVETGRTSATVAWVATGDDSLTGTACVSRVAYSTSPITESNFFACDYLPTNPPGESGTLECALAPNGTLSSCTWYYFAVKTQDDAGRWSALSNVVQAKTTCSGTKIVECYAGDLMAQGGGEEGWELENSVLDLATTTAAATDVYALQTRVAPTAAQAQVRLTFRGNGSFALDQARLAVVDHAADVEVIASGNRVLQGTLAPVSSLLGEQATTLAAVIDSSEDARVVAAGTTWEVTLAGKASAEPALLVELAGYGAAKEAAGVEVQVPFLEGNWRTLAWLHPRAASYAFVVDSLGGNRVRLVFRQECAVKRLAGLTVAQTARLEPLAPRSAVHSTKGEAAEVVSASDEATLSLGKGESVVLTYELPVAKAELKRAAYLLLRGARAAGRVQASSVRASGEAGAAGAVEAVPLPTAFALHQNQPNPVTGMTTVRFDLPRPARVRLEVFDLQGRRIARLVEGLLPAGYHHTEWDGRGSGGNRVGAGVYLCRLQAGEYQAQRKLIVVR